MWTTLHRIMSVDTPPPPKAEALRDATNTEYNTINPIRQSRAAAIRERNAKRHQGGTEFLGPGYITGKDIVRVSSSNGVYHPHPPAQRGFSAETEQIRAAPPYVPFRRKNIVLDAKASPPPNFSDQESREIYRARQMDDFTFTSESIIDINQPIYDEYRVERTRVRNAPLGVIQHERFVDTPSE